MNLKSKEFLNFFFIEAFLFSLTLIAGVFSAKRIQKFSSSQEIEIPPVSLLYFILSFAIATLFIFLLVKFLKRKLLKGKIYKTLFLFTVFLSGLTFFEIWFGEPLALFLISLLIFWWVKKPNVLNQDLLMVFGIAGISSILGLGLKPEPIVFILILFSIYDFVAVYKTKHMVEMAKEMIEQKTIFGFVIPQDIFSFRESLLNVQPGGKFLVLGGGDVALPLLFSVSLLPSGFLNSIIVAAFSLLGLFISFYIFTHQKVRRPIPALPPIAFFSIIGFLLIRILW